MKIRFVIIFLLLCSPLRSQNEIQVYEWEQVKNASPDTVYGISFRKLKLDSLPIKLSMFSHLKILDLSKNKLTKLPDYIGDFEYLEEIDLGKNKLNIFPLELCRLSNVRRLILNRNFFESIPSCISYMESLEYLDLYDSPVKNIPKSLTELPSLKEIDFTGIRYNEAFQSKWQKLLPEVKLVFDPPCNCM